MKIRQRDGTMREVADNYILQDGEALIVGLPFMDAWAMIHDGRGNPAGSRPGFLYSDGNEQAQQAVDDAYAEYDRALGERWRKGPGQRSAESEPQTEPQTFDSAEAALADAYRQYDRDISERWRQGPDQQPSQAESEPLAFDSKEEALAAAYAEYDRDISERWRK